MVNELILIIFQDIITIYAYLVECLLSSLVLSSYVFTHPVIFLLIFVISVILIIFAIFVIFIFVIIGDQSISEEEKCQKGGLGLFDEGGGGGGALFFFFV